jgi:hypothetical protein
MDSRIPDLLREGKTYSAIGAVVGLSRERIRQIANKLGIVGVRSRIAVERRRERIRNRPMSGMKSKAELSHSDLQSQLRYEQETGAFFWITGRRAGILAGTKHADGYIQIRIGGMLYMAHILAWFYVYGRWPASGIDHRNLDRADNRIDNLREATNSQNFGNTKKRVNNTSGYKGVYFDRRTGKWRAEIANVKLGRFLTKEAAAAAYEDAAKIRFGSFART